MKTKLTGAAYEAAAAVVYDQQLKWARHYLRSHYLTPQQLQRVTRQFETEIDCKVCDKLEQREEAGERERDQLLAQAKASRSSDRS